MSFLDKLKQKTAEVAKVAADEAERIWSETIKVPDEVREERFAICKECPNLEKMNRCRLCGCFMEAKTYLPMSSCPAIPKKWDVFHIEK